MISSLHLDLNDCRLFAVNNFSNGDFSDSDYPY